MNTKDPFVSLVKTIRNEGAAYNPPSIAIGTIMKVSPLVVTIGDLQLTKDNILVADFLLANYKRKISIPSTNATGSTTEESITSIGIPSGELNFEDYGFEEKDKVACLATADGQTYILLCKVVKP